MSLNTIKALLDANRALIMDHDKRITRLESPYYIIINGIRVRLALEGQSELEHAPLSTDNYWVAVGINPPIILTKDVAIEFSVDDVNGKRTNEMMGLSWHCYNIQIGDCIIWFDHNPSRQTITFKSLIQNVTKRVL